MDIFEINELYKLRELIEFKLRQAYDEVLMQEGLTVRDVKAIELALSTAYRNITGDENLLDFTPKTADIEEKPF